MDIPVAELGFTVGRQGMTAIDRYLQLKDDPGGAPGQLTMAVDRLNLD